MFGMFRYIDINEKISYYNYNMSDIVIKAENLSKYYRLGVINNGTLFRDIQTWWALKRGKDDPHSKIGQNKYDPTKEGFWALKDLNFEIHQGDRVGIIGKNGAGKSTLLKILSRITAPTEGSVKIKGRVASLLEVGTGFHGELTGRENIYLNGAILGMKRREVARKMDEIIAFSEIEHHIDTPVKRYSSGMYVRLAFAVAAHLESEILIADEVLAVGDAAFQKKALGKMNDLATGEGRTVLFVSHNMNQVKNLCSKGLVLEKGRVVEENSINVAIGRYLTGTVGMSESSEKKFEIDESKDFQLMSVKVVDKNNNRLETFETQEENKIQIECVVRNKIPGLCGYFQIINSNRQPIICFDTSEVLSSFSELEIGTHTYDIIIPKGILAPDQYSFYANFTSNYSVSNFNVDSPLDCCTFQIVDSLTKRSNNRGSLTSVIPILKKIK